MKAHHYLFLLALVMTLAWNTPGYVVGDTVEDFNLKNVDGRMISLASFPQAKGFIVIFDCNTCPYSKAYNERIQQLDAKFASKGYPVIAINPNDPEGSYGDSFEDNVAIAKKKNYSFVYLSDESQQVARRFGATNTPHVFVLVRLADKLKVAYIGTIDDNPRQADAVTKRYVEDAVQSLLAGKSVPLNKTKAIGCGIKWKNG